MDSDLFSVFVGALSTLTGSLCDKQPALGKEVCGVFVFIKKKKAVHDGKM